MLRVFRKDVVWGIAVIAWLCGTVAAKRLAWEPLPVAMSAAAFLAALDRLSTGRYPAVFSEHRRRDLEVGMALILAGMPGLAWIVDRLPNESWVAAMVMPALLYGAARVCSLDRLTVFGMLGLATVTSLAPVTYLLSAASSSNGSALLLWASLGTYCILSVLLLHAKTLGSKPALWAARLGSFGALLGSGMFFLAKPTMPRGLLAFAFVMAAFRAWSYRAGRPVSLTRLGTKELSYNALAAVVIDTAVLLA